MKAKLLSMILALVVIVSMVPVNMLAVGTAFAEEVPAVTFTKGVYGEHRVDLYFTINENAPNEVTIGDIGILACNLIHDAIANTANKIEPEDYYQITVHIQNNSPFSFVYKDNGMELGTVVENEYLTGFIGYDGHNISQNHVGNICLVHSAFASLYEDVFYGSYTLKYVFSAEHEPYRFLATKKGYSGENALSDFILDYYKNKYNDSELTWEKLEEEHWDALRDDLFLRNKGEPKEVDGPGIILETVYAVNKNKDPKIAADSHWRKYIFPTRQYGMEYEAIRWPEKKLAELSYDIFYNDIMIVDFDDATFSDHVNPHYDLCIGDYQTHDTSAYIQANTYLQSKGQIASGESGEFSLTLVAPGLGITNPYDGLIYKNLFSLTVPFERVPTVSIAVQKVWDDENNKDSIRPTEVTVQLHADGTAYGDAVVLNAGNNWSHTFDGLPKETNGTEIAYTISESAVTGYSSQITGNAADGFVITNVHVPAVLTGGLTVSKSVSGNAADPTKAFPFTVTLNDQGISGAYGEMTFSNGIASFVLKDGESKTASGLPAGVAYIVTESGNDGYVVTVNGGSETTASGVVVADQVAVAAFNNFKAGSNVPTPTPAPPVADLPQTGDNSHIALWGAMLILSAAGVFIILGKHRLDGTR